MNVDISMTNDGDLVLTPSGDLALCYGDAQIAQEVLFRLKTNAGDWLLSPSVGCSLEQFIGQPNTPATHSLIEQRVETALTYDGLLTSPSIDCTDISENQVMILVSFLSVEGLDREIIIQSFLDIRSGQVEARITSQNLI